MLIASMTSTVTVVPATLAHQETLTQDVALNPKPATLILAEMALNVVKVLRESNVFAQLASLETPTCSVEVILIFSNFTLKFLGDFNACMYRQPAQQISRAKCLPSQGLAIKKFIEIMSWMGQNLSTMTKMNNNNKK